MAPHPEIRAFFDEPTKTVTYLVSDPATGDAAVIDPVLDFEFASGTVDTRSADAVLQRAAEENLSIKWVLETHVHADHLSGAPYIKARTGAKIGIGEHIRDVQKIFRPIFNATDLTPDGSDFDKLFVDGEKVELGGLKIEVIHTPGHTPADVSYRIGDAVFVGDTLFMPDYGTARADFPGGDARQLYRSIRHILSLPPQTRLFMCHDYKAPGRDSYAWETTVQEQREKNVHIKDGVSEDDYVAMRDTPRRATFCARAADAFDPGQHARRSLPAGRGKRRTLHDGAGENPERRRCASGRPAALRRLQSMSLQDLLTVLSGALVGFSLGLIGGGGSVLAVPLLLYVVGVRDSHVAIGTSALAVAMNAFANLAQHARAGTVKWPCALTFGASGVVGALIGSTIGKIINGEHLLIMFALVMVAVAISMLRDRAGDGDPEVHMTAKMAPRLVAVGLGAGLLSGFFGIGGGFLIVPGLIFSSGMPILNAVGSSLFSVGAFGVTTASNYALSGLVDWKIAILFILGGVAGGMVGMRLAVRMASRRGLLVKVFAFLLFAVAVYILYRTLAPWLR